MKYDTLDFTVTIHVPQGAVTTAGESVILLMERRLLTEETVKPVVFGESGHPLYSLRGKIVMTLSDLAHVQGVHHGTKVEIGGVDIIWDDEDWPSCCQACHSCPCVCKAPDTTWPGQYDFE